MHFILKGMTMAAVRWCRLAKFVTSSSNSRMIHTSNRFLTSAGNDPVPEIPTQTNSPPSGSLSKGGFVKAMAKIEGHESFPKSLRFSPYVQMGDPQGKIAEGTIIHVVDNDLYIDFGAKFNCVCPRPQKNGNLFSLGKKVRVMVHDLELSTRFLGAKTDVTILEADCSLLGLVRSDKDRPKMES